MGFHPGRWHTSAPNVPPRMAEGCSIEEDGDPRQMTIRKDLREGSLRIALVLLASYVGGGCGALASGYGSLDWGILNPGNMLMMFGAIITPVANAIFLVHIALAAAYVLGPVPRWACVIFTLTSGLIIAIMRLTWRSG